MISLKNIDLVEWPLLDVIGTKFMCDAGTVFYDFNSSYVNIPGYTRVHVAMMQCFSGIAYLIVWLID
jgi:hypothetical protein